MRVLITKNFDKKYLKNLSKYFNKEQFFENLKNKSYKFISLHFPYFKFKNSINSVDFRGIIAIVKDENILPLIVFLKKDKNYGENLNWQNFESEILKEYEKSIKDIENGDFEIYK